MGVLNGINLGILEYSKHIRGQKMLRHAQQSIIKAPWPGKGNPWKRGGLWALSLTHCWSQAQTRATQWTEVTSSQENRVIRPFRLRNPSLQSFKHRLHASYVPTCHHPISNPRAQLPSTAHYSGKLLEVRDYARDLSANNWVKQKVKGLCEKVSVWVVAVVRVLGVSSCFGTYNGTDATAECSASSPHWPSSFTDSVTPQKEYSF